MTAARTCIAQRLTFAFVAVAMTVAMTVVLSGCAAAPAVVYHLAGLASVGRSWDECAAYPLATLGGGPDVAARYTGLSNQRVGVMTWAERSVKYYYSYMGSDVQSDISSAVTERLRAAADPKARAEELTTGSGLASGLGA